MNITHCNIAGIRDWHILAIFQIIKLCPRSNKDTIADQHVHVIGGGGAKLLVTRLSSLHEEVRDAVKAGVPVEKAIRICGENPARANGLFPKKGCIRPGSDADLVILDEEFLVDTVFVRGQKMVEYGKALVKGTFETD